MIRSRLSYVRYYLRILTLMLPAAAYYIAIRLRFGFNLFFPHRSGRLAIVLEYYAAHYDRMGDRGRGVRPVERRATLRARQEKSTPAGSSGLHLRHRNGTRLSQPASELLPPGRYHQRLRVVRACYLRAHHLAGSP